MTIGVCGPVDLKLLDWELKGSSFPETNAFPLTSQFINALLKRGYNVIAYTNSSTISEPLVYEGKQLKVCIGRQKPQPGRRFYRFEIREMKELIQAHPADFISAFWSYEFAWAAQATGIPTAVCLHDVAWQILLNHRDMFRLIRWMMNYVVVSRAKHIVANSTYTYNLLDRSTRKKARVINNFFPADFEQSFHAPEQKQPYIITVAMGFSHRKNISTALQAFAIIRQRFPDLEYHLVGAETEEGGLAHQYAKANNLAQGVRFIGAIPHDQVMDKIAAASLLLHPAREESFGMALLEAMVAKTPVVGGKNSGYVPYLLDQGRAGLMCDVESVEEMADAVLKILSDDVLRQTLVAHAYAFAYGNYSENVIIEQHLAYYAEIMGMPLQPTAHSQQEHALKRERAVNQ